MSVEGEQFASARAQNIAGLGRDHDLRSLSRTWQVEAARHNYIYNFSWLGRPIMQLLIGDYAPPEVTTSIRTT